MRHVCARRLAPTINAERLVERNGLASRGAASLNYTGVACEWPREIMRPEVPRTCSLLTSSTDPARSTEDRAADSRIRLARPGRACFAPTPGDRSIDTSLMVTRASGPRRHGLQKFEVGALVTPSR